MAASNKKLVIVGLLAIAIIGSEAIMANAQICSVSKEGLEACKPSVSGQKPQVPPTQTCCSALFKADLQCLCGYKNYGFLKYYGIDPQQAMTLPVLCKIKDPSWHC